MDAQHPLAPLLPHQTARLQWMPIDVVKDGWEEPVSKAYKMMTKLLLELQNWLSIMTPTNFGRPPVAQILPGGTPA